MDRGHNLGVMVKKEDDIVINPEKSKKDPSLPECGILFVNPQEYQKVVKIVSDEGWKQHFLYNSKLHVHTVQEKFIAGPCVGAPMAVMTLEKLIALGAKKIIVFGWCGSLAEEDEVGKLIVADKTVCGEGTSKYYSSQIEGYTSSSLNEQVKEICEDHQETTLESTLWSTDAPYRESRIVLEKLAEEHGVTHIDMEGSALTTVASFRGVDLSILLIVSDMIGKTKWQHGYLRKDFKKKTTEVTKFLINSIGN